MAILLKGNIDHMVGRRPIRNHQLIGYAPIDEQISTSQEAHKIFMCFFIASHFGVVATPIYGKVDCIDQISHVIAFI